MNVKKNSAFDGGEIKSAGMSGDRLGLSTIKIPKQYV